MNRYDVLVIGAGPAGLAAARGGQIWRGRSVPLPYAKLICGARVVAAPAASLFSPHARERFLRFPDWTLPRHGGPHR